MSTLPPRLRGREQRARRFRPAGSGSSSTAAGMSLAEFTAAQQQARRDAAMDKLAGGGGGIRFGLGNLWDEFSGGVTALASLVTPGRDGPGWADAGKGIASWAASVPATLMEGPQGLFKDPKYPEITEGYKDAVGRFLDDEDPEAFRPQSFRDAYKTRGLLPAVVDQVGLVALAGGAATAPVRAASATARAARRPELAARLAASHQQRMNNPIVRAMQHPYLAAGRAVESSWITPAATRWNKAQGIEDLSPPAAGTQAAVPQTAITTPPDPPRPGDRLAADIDARLTARRAKIKLRDELRNAEMARNIAGRSPAVRESVHIARDLLMSKAAASGKRITRKEASLMVGDEIHARYTGLKALEDKYPDLPKEVFVQHGIRERFIPDELWDAELEGSILGAVAKQKAEHANVRNIMLGSRRGDKGLTGLADDAAMDPAPTPKQVALLRDAEKKLERANSDVLARIEGREAKRRLQEIDRLDTELGRLAAQKQRLLDDDAAAVEAFDHARTNKIPAFRTPEAMAAAIQEVYDRTLAEYARNGDWGGASYDPHTQRFLVPGEDTGFAVGLVPGTARRVRLEDFTPDDIALVVRAHQDVLRHPNTVVGTWVEKDKSGQAWVYIDPSEIVTDYAEAMVRGAVREQLAIFDFAADEAPTGVLQGRPDIAAQFLDKHTNLSHRTNELIEVAERTQLDKAQIPVILDMLMRNAARAQDIGLVKHPDEFFRDYVSKFEFAERPSPKNSALRQIVLEKVINKDLWDVATSVLDDVAKMRAWYFEGHALVEKFRGDGSPNITLGDGSRVNAADLFYDILSVLSINAAPDANLTKALTIMGRFERVPKKQVAAVERAMKKVVSGRATLEEAFGLVEGSKVADLWGDARGPVYPQARQYLTEIFAGQTIDKWSPDTITAANRAFGGKQAPIDVDRALDFLRKNHREYLDRVGPEVAVRELLGRAHRAKLVAFRNNLRDPHNSMDVTMDAQMERLIGEMMPDKAPTGTTFNDAWVRASEDIRELAAELTEITGEAVMPHEIQAVLWLYTKQEVNRIQVGHFNAYVAETMEQVLRGEPLDASDPMSAWLFEAGGPYRAAREQQLAAEEIAAYNASPDRTGPKKKKPDQQSRWEVDHKIMGRDGKVTTERVAYRPAWGAATIKEKAEQWARREARWEVTRERINERLASGDVDGAAKILDEYATKVRTTTPKQGGLLDDADAGSFLDIWNDPSGRPSLVDAATELDRLGGAVPGVDVFHQMFRDKILGEFVPQDGTTRGVIRIFEDGNLATLVHESGHLLRRILPKAEVRAIEAAYEIPHGKKWSVEAEERFANDLLKFIISEKAPPGLKVAFQVIRKALSDIWQGVRASFQATRVHPTIKDTFDRWLSPDLRPMPDLGPYPGLDVTPETGTLAQRAARPPKRPFPTKPHEMFQAGRKGQAALARMEKNALRRKSLAATEAKVQKAIEEIRTILNEGRLPAALERRTLQDQAAKIVARVNKELETPSSQRTPVRWRPLWDAVVSLGEEAKTNPALADMLADLPQTLAEVQRLAIDRGFDPTHFRHFSPQQVNRLVFGALRLGRGGLDAAHEASEGTRNVRTGALQRARGVDRSLEAFLAATVEVIQAKHTDNVIDWVESEAARTIPAGARIPDGWAAWDPVRTYLLTGTELSEDGLRQVQKAATDTVIVPKPVIDTLYQYSRDYDHSVWRRIRQATSPWRTLVLTLSPGWYMRNIVGNAVLAQAEGVKVRDWVAAWRSANTRDEIGRFADVPWVTSETLAHEAAVFADDSVIPRRGLHEAMDESGRVKGAVQHALRSMLRVNEVVDEFARAAVYHQGRRLNMPPEEAWKRAKEALVDYSALSEFERAAARAVIPFYSWQKGILRVTLNQAIDHPARTSILMLLGQMQGEYVADRLGVAPHQVPGYYETHMLGNRVVRSWNPFADADELLSPEGITRSLNPFLEIAIRKGLGAPEFYTDERRMGYFGTPQQDVNVTDELTELLTRSPGGRIISDGPGQNLLGLPKEVDIDALRSRLLRSRETIWGVPNPEDQRQLLPTRS